MAGEASRFVKVVSGDAVIVGREEGSGGDTVLFSHGGLTTMALFGAPVALMSLARRCIRWDHRGQGASTGGSGWSRRDYLEQIYTDALRFIDHVGVTSCHWVGQSIRAYVGMRLAANHPDFIRSLVLLSPRVRANPLSFKLQMEAFGQVLTVASHSRFLDSKVRDVLTIKAMEGSFGSTFLEDPERADAREHFRRDLTRRLLAVLPALRGTIWYPKNQPEMIAQVSAPTLILAGKDDQGSGGGVTNAREVHALIRDSSLLTVQNAGHALLMEQPDLVSRAIKDFVDKHDA